MGERLTGLLESKRSRTAVLALATGLALAGCTSDTNANSSDNAADRMACTADPASAWKPVGDNFKNGTVATLLGVDEDELKNNGVFGPISCPEQIELVDFTEGGDGLIVSVNGQGPNCLAYYRQDDESKGEAVCVSRD